ncbi:hypothetical protein HDU97_004704 [Phlyctochytrium planicorne]|nr:hypothetical protein HDU97_004704 [Phlyctochytrium planicorne]
MTVTIDDDGASGSSGKILNVVFLIDITGSRIRIHIWTFTEEGRNCYVTSSPPVMTPEQLVNYARSIQLCCPPGIPGVSASGGDGPENVVAGIALLKEKFAESRENVLCFIITDANPHHKAHGSSGTAQAEKEWLRARGFDTDIFKVLNGIIEEVNVTFVPVLYFGNQTNKFYQQAAVTTGGLILCPQKSDPETLANGLEIIMKLLQATTLAGRADPVEVARLSNNLQGFGFCMIPEDEFEPLDEDPYAVPEDRELGVARTTGMDAALMGLMETACDRFTGKRSAKRIKGVNPKVVVASVKFLVMAILKACGRKDLVGDKLESYAASLIVDLKAANVPELEMKLAEELLELSKNSPVLVGDEALKYAGFVEDIVEEVMDEDGTNSFVKSAVGSPVQCIVTLESALSVLAELAETPSTVDEMKPWMELIMQVCMVRLIDIRFMKDPLTGLDDFADAWSARINEISTASVMSAAAAAELRVGISDGTSFKCPLTAKEFSSVLLLSHPDDPVLGCAYRFLTHLPALYGVIQSYLVSGGLSVFPSLGAGLQAASLFHLSQPAKRAGKGIRWQEAPPRVVISQANWEVTRCLLLSLREHAFAPASTVVKSLRSGKGLNPEDAVPKLIAGIVGYLNPLKKVQAVKDGCVPVPKFKTSLRILLKQLFEEMAGAAIGSFYNFVAQQERDGKVPEAGRFVLPEDIAKALVSTEGEPLFSDAFDPTTTQHVIEKYIQGTDEGASSSFVNAAVRSLMASTQLFKDLCEHYRILVRLLLVANVYERDPEKAFEGTKAHGLPEALVKAAMSARSPSTSPLPTLEGEDRPTETLLSVTATAPVTLPSADEILAKEPTDEELLSIMAIGAVLKSRTGRYTMEVDETGATIVPPVWKKLPEEDYPIAKLCRKLVADTFASNLKEWNAARAAHAKDTLFAKVVDLASNLPAFEEPDLAAIEGDEAKAEAIKAAKKKHRSGIEATLASFTVNIFGKVYKLQRMQVPTLLTLIPASALPVLGMLLVVGKEWTPEPPSQLVRHINPILEAFGTNITLSKQEGIRAILSARPICQRKAPDFNRHGHNAENPYPGVFGWTQSYEDKVAASGKVSSGVMKRRMGIMKRFVDIKNAVFALEDAVLRGTLTQILDSREWDVNGLPRLTAKIQNALPARVARDFKHLLDLNGICA